MNNIVLGGVYPHYIEVKQPTQLLALEMVKALYQLPDGYEKLKKIIRVTPRINLSDHEPVNSIYNTEMQIAYTDRHNEQYDEPFIDTFFYDRVNVNQFTKGIIFIPDVYQNSYADLLPYVNVYTGLCLSAEDIVNKPIKKEERGMSDDGEGITITIHPDNPVFYGEIHVVLFDDHDGEVKAGQCNPSPIDYTEAHVDLVKIKTGTPLNDELLGLMNFEVLYNGKIDDAVQQNFIDAPNTICTHVVIVGCKHDLTKAYYPLFYTPLKD